MGTPNRIVLLAVLLSLGALLAALAPATVLAASYTATPLTFTTHVGPDDATTCLVDATLYRPAGATAAHPDPAVLTTNGFGGSKGDLAVLGKQLAARGYVVLAYSGLGFGKSNGCPIYADNPQYDGKAASQLVTFLGGGLAADDGTKVDYVVHDRVAHDGRPHRFDPRVGTIGGSYGGGFQFAVAGIDPRVDTMIPIITWNDLTYSLAPNNAGLADTGVTNEDPGVIKRIYLAGLLGGGAASASPMDPSLTLCPNFSPDLCLPFAPSLATGYPGAPMTAVLRQSSPHYYMSRIRIPTMLWQGEVDSFFNLQEAVATYTQLRAQGTPVKLVWQSWGHSSAHVPAPGEFVLTALEDGKHHLSFEGRLGLEWLDHYLRGDPHAPSLDFSFYRPWVRFTGSAEPAYGRVPAYPAVRTPTDLKLSGTDQLVDAAAPVRAGSATFITPPAGGPTSTGEATIVTTNPGAPHDAPGTYAEYQSPPLTVNTDVVGIPTVDVNVSGVLASGQSDPSRQLTLFFKLYDVDAAGAPSLPQRLVSATRIPVVGRIVHVTLPGLVYRFAQGHRIALVIAGSDSDYVAGPLSDHVTISTAPSKPGVLHLPVAAPGSYGGVVYAGAPRATLGAPRLVRVPKDRGRTRFTVRWSGSDDGGRGLSTFQVQQRGSGSRWRTVALTDRHRKAFTGVRGRSYAFRVRARDVGGNWSPWSRFASVRVSGL